MKVLVGAKTDVGRARRRNEDSYLLRDPLFAVADGMGGHRGGDVASSLSVETVSDVDLPDEGSFPVLVEQIKRANQAVLERGESDRTLRGMGTTFTAILVEGDKAHVAHVGDSRAYRLHDGALQQLTEDHTLVQRMVREGKLRPEQARHHPQRNIITRGLGVDEDLEVEELTLPLLAGDRLLICSDGLSGMLDDDEIQGILGGHSDPQAAADALVEAANVAGGEDNITVIVLDVVDDGASVPVGGTRRATDTAGAAPVPATSSDEPARPPRRPVRRGRLVAWGVGVILVLVAVVIGVRAYLNHQWYVGEANGRVVIYQGIPTTVLGFELSHVSRSTDLSAAAAARLDPWRDLSAGITANNLAEAEAIVSQIRQDLASSAGGTTPAPTPAPSATTSPSGSA
jgi:protein phosphatase